MKLHVLSDLHLSVHGLEPSATDADVVVLAGDIARPDAAVAWASQFAKPTLYVPGNHEFYGGNMASVRRALRESCAAAGIHLLDNAGVVIDGVRFLGSTLWSDFRIAGEGAIQAEAIAQSVVFNRDFSRIRIGPEDAERVFAPGDAMALFAENVAWLEQALGEPHTAGPTVVITHHAPTPKSIHPRFAGSLLNTNFVSDVQALIQARRPDLWIHGHTHDSFDYVVGATRVLCNARGYARDGVAENANFDPALTVAVPTF